MFGVFLLHLCSMGYRLHCEGKPVALALVFQNAQSLKENFVLEWTRLYEGYPHTTMKLSLKFYMLNQVRSILSFPQICTFLCADGILAPLLSRALFYEDQKGRDIDPKALKV